MTNYEVFRRMTLEQMATNLSRIHHSAEYEVGDYDPSIMQWLKNEAKELLVEIECGDSSLTQERVAELAASQMDEGTLMDWFISSVSADDTPVWTEEHIYEILHDFYVIPRNEQTEAALEVQDPKCQ